MLDNYHALRLALIVALLPAILAGKTQSEGPRLVEQTLEAIRNCMDSSLAPWPEEWKKEYLKTIRRAVEFNQDDSHYASRLEILRKGFTDCWEGLTKKKDRPFFEVYRCRMRWYVEHLMGTEFPSEEEKRRLRDQYTEIWDYAADSLLTQFTFLDPNIVQTAKAHELNVCYRKIDAPLMPVYLRPMCTEHVDQIKQRWDKLRYTRVDLWHRLHTGSKMSSVSGDATIPNTKRDYKLTKESFSQLLGLVWMIVPQRPDYYIEALENQTKELRRHQESKREATREQERLEKTLSKQLLQTEYIGFLMAALLESPQCFDGSVSMRTQEKLTSEQQNKTAKGGGAYEVDNGSGNK